MPEPNPLTNIATKSMGMMPGMGLAMGAGSVLGGLMGGGGLHGKEIGNLLGFEDKNTNNKQKLEFDNITINSLKIEEASIGNLTVESMDKEEDSDFDKIVDETGDKKNIKEDKGKEDKGFLDTLWDYSLPGMVSGLFESEEESGPDPFTGEMGNPPTTPIETMSDANSEANLEASEVLLGQSSFGGGLPSIGEDLSDAVSLLQEISDNTKAIEEMFNWEEFKPEGGADKGEGGLWGGIKDAVGFAKDAVGGLWGGAKDVAGGLWEQAKDVAGGLWEGVGDVFGFDTASDVEAKAAAEANNQGGERGPMMWMDTVGNITAIRDSSYRLEDSLIEIKDILTDCCSWTMKTGDYNDPFDDEDIALDDFSIENPVAVYEDRTEIPEPELVSDLNDDHISYDDRTEIPELVSDINEDHKELESTLRENIIEKSLNMDKQKSTNQSASKQSTNAPRVPRDRNIATVQENASKPRGMMPSYTKAPPPPRGMNQKTINELQTYLRFPKWWTRMG